MGPDQLISTVLWFWVIYLMFRTMDRSRGPW
jgi:hypothetical protein